MFQTGDIAIIDTNWLEEHPELHQYQRVTVIGDTTAIHDVWVDCGGEPVKIPEHHLNRPPASETKSVLEEVLDAQREARRNKPIKRETPPARLSVDQRKSLCEAVVGMVIDWRGHHERGAEWASKGWHQSEPERRKRMLLGNLSRTYDAVEVTPDDADAILMAFKAGKPLDRFIPLVTGSRYQCPNCVASEHKDPQVFETNGVAIRPTKDCPRPDGLVTEWEMNFPSGKVIIDDDLRYLCKISAHRSINTRLGTHLQILDYANEGLAIGFGVGNSSPHVYRTGEGTYEIGRKMKGLWWVDEGTPGAIEEQACEDGDEPRRWYVHERPEGGDEYPDDVADDLSDGVTDLCSVCTDLWAYSIIDLEEAKRRADYYGIDLDKHTENWSVNIVDIEPGTYKFRHFHTVDSDGDSYTNATFERIGEATEPVDWCALDAAFNVHITQAVQAKAKAKAWQNIYTGNSAEWARQCASVISSELRGGLPDRDWHKNGFRMEYLRADIEKLEIREIPSFHFQYHWEIGRTFIETTVTRKDAIFSGDVFFNSSYAIAAGLVLESTISYGLPTHVDTNKKIYDHEAKREIPNPHYDQYNVAEVRKQMHKAAKLWKGLIERYPHVAEVLSDFAAWMADDKAVKLWINNFDLGPVVFNRVAQKAKEEADQLAGEARRCMYWMVNNAGVEVTSLDGMVGLTTDDEAKPDHVNVVFGGDVVEMPLKDLTLTEAAEKARKDAIEVRIQESLLDFKVLYALDD